MDNPAPENENQQQGSGLYEALLNGTLPQMDGRIAKETEELLQNLIPGILVTRDFNDVKFFHVIMAGPQESPYEGGVFKLKLTVPEDYPFRAPKIRSLTKIYHPNIDDMGRICLDELEQQWASAMIISRVLLYIQTLLSDPTIENPIATDVAAQWIIDKQEAIRAAKECTRLFAAP